MILLAIILFLLLASTLYLLIKMIKLQQEHREIKKLFNEDATIPKNWKELRDDLEKNKDGYFVYMSTTKSLKNKRGEK